MFKIKDRVAIKFYYFNNIIACGKIVKIAKHPTMYKIDIDKLGRHRYEWVFEKELLHIVTICA